MTITTETREQCARNYTIIPRSKPVELDELPIQKGGMTSEGANVFFASLYGQALAVLLREVTAPVDAQANRGLSAQNAHNAQ